MTPDELINVIATCHQADVRLLRMGDLVIKFGAARPKAPKPEINAMPVQPAPELTPEQAAKIEHKIEEMASAMKLDDKDLIERMFPLPNAEEQSEED